MADQQTVLLEAQMAFAVSALKAVTIVNGAAVLALLAFLGHVIGQNSVFASAVIAEMTYPMTLFALGTVTGVSATGVTYLAQALFVERPNLDRVWWCRPGEIARFIGLALVVLGLMLFIWGIVSSGTALNDASKIQNQVDSKHLSTDPRESSPLLSDICPIKTPLNCIELN